MTGISPLPYPKNAKARIQGLDPEEFLIFQDSIPEKDIDQILEILPAIPGFRRTTKLGREKLLSNLVARLTGKQKQKKKVRATIELSFETDMVSYIIFVLKAVFVTNRTVDSNHDTVTQLSNARSKG